MSVLAGPRTGCLSFRSFRLLLQRHVPVPDVFGESLQPLGPQAAWEQTPVHTSAKEQNRNVWVRI